MAADLEEVALIDLPLCQLTTLYHEPDAPPPDDEPPPLEPPLLDDEERER